LYFGGQAHATTVSSATRLTTTILASDIDAIGTVAITLTNPAPALPSPSSVPFTVTQLALSLAPTNPITLPVGTPGTLTATLSAVQANVTVLTLTTNHPPG
jgi:hypothetical protein